MMSNVLQKISTITCALLLCGVVHAQSLSFSSDQVHVLGLAAELYPDLFGSHGEIKSAQGYIYLTYNSGVTVGFKDGALYVAGGPFGAAIQNKGAISQVATSLTNLKNSVAVTPTADMTSLFNFAAQAYPSLFNNGSPFMVSADGYLYKSFASGLYAAIKNGSVFVKGGSFGSAYTSVGALNSVLSQLQTAVNGGNNSGGGTTIPQGDYNLAVTGTITVSGFSSAYTYNIANMLAPSINDHDAIRKSFVDSLDSAVSSGLTITSFSYDIVSSTSNLIEYNVTVAATVSSNGFSLPYSFKLNYKYTK